MKKCQHQLSPTLLLDNSQLTLIKIHQVLREEWQKIFQQHADSEQAPSFTDFVQDYGYAWKDIHKAPTRLPDVNDLDQIAQKAKAQSAAGSVGWLPVEFKYLPINAWQQRAVLLELCIEQARFPTAYQLLNTPCLPKKGEGSEPLDHRSLSVFSAVYRVEAGAFFRILQPWLQCNAHKDCCGGIANREPIEAAWDAVSQLENATLTGYNTAMLSVDYFKFFDTFQPDFSKDMLIHVGSHQDWRTPGANNKKPSSEGSNSATPLAAHLISQVG